MSEDKLTKLGVAGVVIVGTGVIGGLKFLGKIDNGYVGARYPVNNGIKNKALTQGVKSIRIDKVVQHPIHLQTIQSKNISVSTSGGKKITIDIKYDYKVDSIKAAEMYKEFGNTISEGIESGWLKSKLQKVAREVYTEYSLLDVLSGDSSKIEIKVLTDFAKSVGSKGSEIEDVTLGVPDVDKETQRSIDTIIRAGQENEKAKLDAKTAETQADSEAYKKTKVTEVKVESNRRVTESVTDNLTRYEEARARKKYEWVTVDGTDTVVADEAGK